MKRLVLIIGLCLLAGTTPATFEIADPAAEVIDDLENAETSEGPLPSETGGDLVVQANGNTPCDAYLSYEQKRSVEYWAAINWLQGFIDGASPGLINSSDDTDMMALWIETYCRENSNDSLKQAATSLVDTYG